MFQIPNLLENMILDKKVNDYVKTNIFHTIEDRYE